MADDRVQRGWSQWVGCWLGTAWLAVSAVSAVSAEALEQRALFQGRDLTGWSTWLVDTGREDPRGVFSVVNGLLRISGDGLGYLATEEEFADYRLVVEWRWGMTNTAWGQRLGRARDSGVFVHATGPPGNSHDGQGAFMAALEYNLFQGAVGDLLLIRGTAADGSLIAPRAAVEAAEEKDADGFPTWFPGGKEVVMEVWGRVNAVTKSMAWEDRLDFRGSRDVERAPGVWNESVIEAVGDRLRFYLNGRLVNEMRGVWPRRGRILLQCEGSEIYFRRVSWIPLGITQSTDPCHSR